MCSVRYKVGETIKKTTSIKKKKRQIFKQFKIGLLLSQENSESFTWQEYFITQEAQENVKTGSDDETWPSAVPAPSARREGGSTCLRALPGHLRSPRGRKPAARWLAGGWLAGKPEGPADVEKAGTLCGIRVSVAGNSGRFTFPSRGSGCWV